MKIFLVAPKSISNHRKPGQSFRYDYAFWNFYFPLLSLGHEVTFFDTSHLGDQELQPAIEKVKPELLFCIMTGDTNYTPQEPWDTVKQETKKGRLKTFNWFCDDSWRFDGFSSNVCHNFHACSTPEQRFVEKYKEIGYNNIIYGTWHANADFYAHIGAQKHSRVGFIGAPTGDRQQVLDGLRRKEVEVLHPERASFEDLLYTYHSSLLGLNLSKNPANMQRQVKGRLFEIPATQTLMITETTPDVENYFVPDRDIITFDSFPELAEKVKFLLSKPALAKKIAQTGFAHFMKHHESKVRLASVLEQIEKI